MATAGAARPASAFRCGTRKRLRTSPPHCHLAGWYFNFFKVADTVELRISKTRTSSGEIWERTSLALVRPSQHRERFGPFTYEQELPIENGDLHFFLPAAGFSEIPLPPMLVSLSCSKEFAMEGSFHFALGTYARSP
jgi:hypothetical protein